MEIQRGALDNAVEKGVWLLGSLPKSMIDLSRRTLRKQLLELAWHT
jgi:hypothetical protein